MHTAVLKKEVIHYLDPRPNDNFIDCTFGWGGHAQAILERNGPNGLVLGLDWDETSLNWFCAHNPSTDRDRIILVNRNFSDLKLVVAEKNFHPIAGILLDLGMSSWHLEESQRGFSFLKKEKLDMRYNGSNPLTAKDILNSWQRESLEKILREEGEERFARQIAKKITEARVVKAIETTEDLVSIIARAIPARFRRERAHFATRTFRALRMAVNSELKNLKAVLPQVYEVLEPGGRIAVISFHSLEDRIVKIFFRELAKNYGAEILTKKPIIPNREEIKNNPSSRSAKLRAIKKPKPQV